MFTDLMSNLEIIFTIQGFLDSSFTYPDRPYNSNLEFNLTEQRFIDSSLTYADKLYTSKWVSFGS